MQQQTITDTGGGGFQAGTVLQFLKKSCVAEKSYVCIFPDRNPPPTFSFKNSNNSINVVSVC